MTIGELHRLPWRMQSHLAMEHEHCAVYRTIVNGREIFKCVHVKKRNFYDFGRSYTHYQIDGKVYKTHKKALEVINQ